MRLNDGTEIRFEEDRYVVGGRRAIEAYDAKTGEPYASLTINLPDMKVPDDIMFFNEDSIELVVEMTEQDYIFPLGFVKYNMGRYPVGKMTEKFDAEVTKYRRKEA